MKRLLFVLAVSALPIQAFAGEAPAFLSGDRTWGSSPQACKAIDGEDAMAFTLSRKGIYGLEFGCNFLDFLPVRDGEGGEVFAVVAIASCGDDSGISRPDLFNISVNENTLYVTSQNDYAYVLSKGFETQPDPVESGIVEKQFELCK
jgi:hypothetical protein